jgi:hypothetical protein
MLVAAVVDAKQIQEIMVLEEQVEEEMVEYSLHQHLMLAAAVQAAVVEDRVHTAAAEMEHLEVLEWLFWLIHLIMHSYRLGLDLLVVLVITLAQDIQFILLQQEQER